MKGTTFLKALAVATALPLLYLADVSPGTTPGLTLVRGAYAVVGAPMTPMSVAGVARRTTAVAVTATAASASAASQQQAAAASQQQAATAKQQAATAEQQAAIAKQQAATAQQQAAAARPPGAPPVGSVSSALPAGCTAENRGGVEYQNCGGVTYRAAFQGNNLVYVVQ
jgi:CCR4-NOT transcriptional regulation complex NOT5 subunit